MIYILLVVKISKVLSLHINTYNKACKYFLNFFIDIYDKSFPKSEIKVKFKSDQSAWISKGITKSAKKKQRLYEQFLKNRTPKN